MSMHPMCASGHIICSDPSWEGRLLIMTAIRPREQLLYWRWMALSKTLKSKDFTHQSEVNLHLLCGLIRASILGKLAQ